MSEEILEFDGGMFQMPNGGTVLTGFRGDGWDLARIGDSVELRSPDGRSIRTITRGLEIIRKGVLGGPPFPGGVWLADAVGSGQLPTGTRIVRVS